EIVREEAQQHGFVIRAKVEKNLGDVGWGKIAKDGAKLREIAFSDQLHQFWLQQIAYHVPNQTQVLSAGKAKLLLSRVFAAARVKGFWLMPGKCYSFRTEPFTDPAGRKTVGVFARFGLAGVCKPNFEPKKSG